MTAITALKCLITGLHPEQCYANSCMAVPKNAGSDYQSFDKVPTVQIAGGTAVGDAKALFPTKP
jgi:hypothetical protein